jgi:predicted nuclease with TOPRIM domain
MDLSKLKAVSQPIREKKTRKVKTKFLEKMERLQAKIQILRQDLSVQRKERRRLLEAIRTIYLSDHVKGKQICAAILEDKKFEETIEDIKISPRYHFDF